ncbi:MAG TPA: S9 family peptidase, partial [Woeseiaceae bacterium]|nr:S9 family peptidase [Woeseiaceae bacterium]
MKLHVPLFPILTAITALPACDRGASATDSAAIDYPQTRTVDQVDDYFGTPVTDPYRWLEDDVRENADVRDWVERQNAVTFAYLETIEEREPIRARLEQLWNYERYGLPEEESGRYFYSYNDGLQNQDVVYTLPSLDAEPELLIDPNTWSEDGTIALAGYWPSPDGRYLAYLVQDGGSDWRSARVLELATGTVLDDSLEWLKFTGLSWSA